ncbi:hypothetical protein CDEST_04182 [Colletotrichum destructivum]|uniref:Protein kinase domain-containing protein n=1 Tax=Colletotrichum destructivum TaxID=34406 RepID=A0AAX4I8C9_9PEZI|nr:hypothetical protein CDEST_04182 [Colletotrichum destructivum]
MVFLARHPQTWPYAPESTGKHLGLLDVGNKKINYFAAQGSARSIFQRLSRDLCSYLECNVEELQESDAHIGLSLYMVGKQAERSKPIVMLVSEDAVLRKTAFRSVRDKSGILRRCPGFELGHMPLQAEFQDFRPLAADSTDLCLFQQPTGDSSVGIVVDDHVDSTCKKLISREAKGDEIEHRLATSGGLILYKGMYMLHAVNHFLGTSGKQVANQYLLEEDVAPETGCSTDEENECEITGWSDFEDDEGIDLADSTSQGSASPRIVEFEDVLLPKSDMGDLDDSDDSDGYPDSLPSIISVNAMPDLTPKSEVLFSNSVTRQSNSRTRWVIEAGRIVMSSRDLDSALVQVQPSTLEDLGYDGRSVTDFAIPLQDYAKHIEPGPRDAEIELETSSGVFIRGLINGTPSFFRLPDSKKFVEVYTVNLKSPLKYGDCGTWVWSADLETKKLFGHVVAGSPTTGLALVMPAHRVFREALEYLSTSSHETDDSDAEGSGSQPSDRWKAETKLDSTEPLLVDAQGDGHGPSEDAVLHPVRSFSKRDLLFPTQREWVEEISRDYNGFFHKIESDFERLVNMAIDLSTHRQSQASRGQPGGNTVSRSEIAFDIDQRQVVPWRASTAEDIHQTRIFKASTVFHAYGMGRNVETLGAYSPPSSCFHDASENPRQVEELPADGDSDGFTPFDASKIAPGDDLDATTISHNDIWALGYVFLETFSIVTDKDNLKRHYRSEVLLALAQNKANLRVDILFPSQQPLGPFPFAQSLLLPPEYPIRQPSFNETVHVWWNRSQSSQLDDDGKERNMAETDIEDVD